jgi:outer membrane murein-binding lipoprotein Lpp
MSEADLIKEILLNFGDKSPVLLVVFMFVKWMWPDVKALISEYLQCRTQAQIQPDPVASSVSGLSARIDALMQGVTGVAATLSGYVDENRRTSSEMTRMVQVVVGLVGDVARDRQAAYALVSSQPPVSPTDESKPTSGVSVVNVSGSDRVLG